MDIRARLSRVFARALVLVPLALVPATAAVAAPPAGDNYLSSLQLMEGEQVMRQFNQVVDTSEATVQGDLFNPSRDGLPLGGGGPETTSCGGTSFGRTVWFDFLPEISGGAEIMASGYDTVVAVYEYDLATSKIVRQVACENRGAGEDLILPSVEGGRAYTVQVGGAGGAGGALDFSFLFFGDRDEDGVLDEEPDECLALPGINAAGGCPPRINASVSLSWNLTTAGLELTTALVRGAPNGARVEARCPRCGVRRAAVRSRGRPVRLSRLAGRSAPPGAVLEVRVTQRPRGSGRYRHGAFGSYIMYVFGPEGIRSRTTRCLAPGSTKPRRRCG
jgi:hypothetical protein